MADTKNICGVRYGRWLVMARAGSRYYPTCQASVAMWLVKCDCGNEKVIQGTTLRSGDSQSCGCLKRDKLSKSSEHKVKKYTLAFYQKSAIQRHLQWDLSDEEFFDLIGKECYYCGALPVASNVKRCGTHPRNGVDRLDNNLGYIIKNVVACCAICNLMKRDMPYGDFIAWVRRISLRHVQSI